MAFEHKEEKSKAKKVESAEKKVQKLETPVGHGPIQGKLDQQTVSQMQATVGNAAVQRMLAQRSAIEENEVPESTAATIASKRGQGQAIDSNMAQRAGQTMGADLSNVNIHTDSTADQLNQDVGARAFTTGNDIFFREGEYNPNSESGQHLLAHELTHVVQQGADGGAIQKKMTVNDPDDQYEAEADSVADQVMSNTSAEVQRADSVEETEEEVQMKEAEEEEIQMMEAEEEEIQMKEGEEEEIQMMEAEEEEIQMMEAEEEELQMKGAE